MINEIITGLILDIVGVLVLCLVAIIDYPHRRIFGEKKWWKKYWWRGWRPIFKVHPQNEKSKWMIKPFHKVARYGIIPPKHQWNVVGFLYVLGGFLLQLKYYLS